MKLSDLFYSHTTISGYHSNIVKLVNLYPRARRFTALFYIRYYVKYLFSFGCVIRKYGSIAMVNI